LKSCEWVENPLTHKISKSLDLIDAEYILGKSYGESTMSYSGNKLDRVMTPEQFTQVVEAILAGKYSWACVLILRFAGYNPLHYIPYRTYNRLMKEHQPNKRWDASKEHSSIVEVDRFQSAPQTTIQDLEYAESASGDAQSDIQGGVGKVIPFPLPRI
jgi:hypothetical protein